MEQSDQIRFWRRCCYCVVTWIAAIIAMGVVKGGYAGWEDILLLPAMRPPGLVVFLLVAYSDPDSHSSGIFGGAMGWIYYAVLTVWSLRARRRLIFVRVLTVLCISLL